MRNSAKEKITFRISKDFLNQIDEYILKNDKYKNRSDYIREQINNCNTTLTTLNSSGIILHSKTFREILKNVKKEEIKELTQRTSAVIHSLLQNSKKTSLERIEETDVLTFIKNVYENSKLIEELHIKKNHEILIMCLTGNNLYSKIFTEYLLNEITQVMEPWYQTQSFSKKPGNLIITLKQKTTNQDAYQFS